MAQLSVQTQFHLGCMMWCHDAIIKTLPHQLCSTRWRYIHVRVHVTATNSVACAAIDIRGRLLTRGAAHFAGRFTPLVILIDTSSDPRGVIYARRRRLAAAWSGRTRTRVYRDLTPTKKDDASTRVVIITRGQANSDSARTDKTGTSLCLFSTN